MLVKNVYVRIGASVLNVAIGLVPFIFIIKVFGKEVVGSIAYYYGLAGALSLFADLGVSTAYNKFLASEENPKDISTYLFLKIILISIYILIFCTAYFVKLKNDDINHMLLLIGFAFILCDLIGQFFTATMIGKRDFVFLSKVEITASVFVCVYNLAICFWIPNIYLLAANMVFFRLIVIIGGVFYFYKYRLLKICRLEWKGVKKYVDYALPIAFSSISARLTSHIDKVLLGRFIGMGELGLYQIAFRCYSVLDKVIKSVTHTMFSETIHRIANVPKFFHKRFRDIVHILNFSGSILALMLIFASTTVITLFFGEDNIRSAFIVKFFALTVLAKLFWHPYGHIVYAIEKHKLVLYLAPLNLIITIVCYYYLIPLKIGQFYLGAAALPLTEFVVLAFPTGLMGMWILKKEYGCLYVWSIISKIWLPLAVFIVIGYLFNYSIFVLAAVLPLFLVVEYYCNILTKERCSDLIKPFKAVVVEP